MHIFHSAQADERKNSLLCRPPGQIVLCTLKDLERNHSEPRAAKSASKLSLPAEEFKYYFGNSI
jgi:hypothetical protein